MNSLKYITSCLVLFFLLLSEGTQAQFYIELNTGYAAPIYYTGKNKSYEQAYPHKYTYNDTSFTEYRKYNMGNGLSFSSTVGYQTKNGLTFGIEAFYLNNKAINFLYNNFRHEWHMEYAWKLNEDRPKLYSYFEQYVNYYSSRISLTPQVGYVFNIKRMFLEVFAGVSFSDVTVYRFFIGEDEAVTPYFVDENQVSHYNPDDPFYFFRYTVSETKHNKKLISPSFGVKYNFPLSENFSINSEVTFFPLLSFNRNVGKFYYSSIRSISNGVETFEEQDYDMLDLVPQVGSVKRFNLNSVNLSLGIRYTFAFSKDTK